MTYIRAMVGGTALGIVMLVAPCDSSAQAPIVLSPKAVATEFLSAASANDWATVIRLTDRQSLWEYVTFQRKQYREARPSPAERMTVERYMQGDSTMPRVVAEWYVKQSERAPRDSSGVLGWTFADVERASQLDSISDEDLYVRRLKAKQPSYQMARVLQQSGCKEDAPPSPNPTRTVQGVALIAETAAIALYEESNGMFNARDFGHGYEQLELRRTKSGWRVVASDAVLGHYPGAVFAIGGTCSHTAPPP